MRRIAFVIIALLAWAVPAHACGWYLIRPSSPTSSTVPNEPLSKWDIERSFDSAHACEGRRTKFIREALHDSVDANGIDKSGIALFNRHRTKGTPPFVFKEAGENPEVYAQCIATDDPRLAR
jgi:hypothetical protein